MKSKIIVSIFCFVTFVTNMYSQTATSINIQDTRAVNDLPNFFGYGMRADFKQIASIGVPGEGYYSTNITIAPWNTSESSGGKNHQMNFNAGGVFYRNAFPTDPQWGAWRQVLMTSENGNVGIGTTNPRASLDMAKDISNGQLGTVFGRLPEVNETGLGTYLGVKGYATQGNDLYNLKSFSIVHDFYGQTNSSINFLRGGSVLGGCITFSTFDNTEKMRIAGNGNVGIGTINPTSKLTVAGNINSREVKVSVDAGADFVFDKDYALPSLQEVEKFVTENKHLPEIASAKEMQKEGINLSEMNIKLLQKIEELTLYVIEQQKLITQQTKELESHKVMLAKIDQMEKTLAKMNTANEK